jgi:hypothetical protein
LRQRLALRAAESCATMTRLSEKARDLRDVEHLAGGVETSPAGRLHRVFRLYASQPPRFDTAIQRVAGLLGLQETFDAGALVNAAAAPDPLMAAARASAAAMKLCATSAGAEIIAFVSADLALANHLRWARPIPLLALAISHPSLRRGAAAGERARRPRPLDDDWPDAVARGYALAVVDAHALAVDLARRADRLLAVAPMLRAKGAGRVVDTCCSPTTPSRSPPPLLAPASLIAPQGASSTDWSRLAPCANSPAAKPSGSTAYEPRQRRSSRPRPL